jgi:hypothetical protein
VLTNLLNAKSLLAKLAIATLIASGFAATELNPAPAAAQTASALQNDFDYYAKFDGESFLRAEADKVVIPESSFTVEAWIKPDTFVT